MSESGRICLPAYEPVPSNYAWRLQSIGAIALSIEVPASLSRQDRHALCGDDVLFKAQSCHRSLQGYLTGRPLPIADYAKLVGRQTVVQQNYAVAG